MAQVEFAIDGNGDIVSIAMQDVSSLLSHPAAFAWIDLDATDRDSLITLQDALNIHHLVVESALDDQTRARIMLYDDLIYLQFFGLRREGDGLEADCIGLLAGEQYLITVRRECKPDLSPIKERWSHLRGKRLGVANEIEGAEATAKVPYSVKLLYAILDELVDGYFTQVDWLGDLVEELEDQVIREEHPNPQIEIQAIRTRLLKIRRLLSPEQEVLNTLLRRDVPIVPERMIPYFADVHDHLLRIHDWMETYRDQLASIVDLQLSLQSNRLDRTVRTLAAASIILMVCSLIAGIYGMNFRHMPELGWRLGYPVTLASMLAVAGLLMLGFRRRGWW